MKMMSIMKRLILFNLLVFGISFSQSYNKVWVHLSDSTYSARLVGLSGTSTESYSILGSYDSNKRSHAFSIQKTGWYNLYFDVNGGTNWTLDSDWGTRYIPGADAREFAFFQDSALTLSELLRLLSSAAEAYIASGGKVTNNPDDKTIFMNASDSTLYVGNPFGKIDTLTVNSPAPFLTNSSVYRTANTSATTVSGFSSSPGANTPKVIYILVTDDITTFEDGAIFDLGGVDLAPQSGDILKFVWVGTKWHGKFDYIE